MTLVCGRHDTVFVSDTEHVFNLKCWSTLYIEQDMLLFSFNVPYCGSFVCTGKKEDKADESAEAAEPMDATNGATPQD